MTTTTMATPRILLAAVCISAAAAALAAPPSPPPAGGVTAQSVLDHAMTLPPIAPADGAVAIPLRSEDPFPWRPVRRGVTITGGEKLKAAYTRTRAEAAGAALVLKPGTLAGLDSITLHISGNRDQTLFLNLKQADGSVWTLGPIRVGTTDREVTLSAADIELDPYQNKGLAAKPTFDASSVYMLTVLDITGYMSTTEPECDWTIASLKAVLR